MYQRCEAALPQSNVAVLSTKPVEITSLTAYANQIKHQWAQYAQEKKGSMLQTSYVDLASIIRTGDTVSVLDLQNLDPFLRVGTTGELLGSYVSLVRYDCGSTPRSMIMASIVFHGHMGGGTQQDGAADVPKEPFDGWHVMPSSDAQGKANVMLKARDMACNGKR